MLPAFVKPCFPVTQMITWYILGRHGVKNDIMLLTENGLYLLIKIQPRMVRNTSISTAQSISNIVQYECASRAEKRMDGL